MPQNINASVQSVSSFFDRTNFSYVIPDYQRPSTWDKDRIEGFLEAIKGDCLLWKNQSNQSPDPLTFLGATIFFIPANNSSWKDANANPSIAPDTIYGIVDGQQRITTLSFLAFCMVYQSQIQNINLACPNEEWYSTSKNPRQSHVYKFVPKVIRQEDNFDTEMTSELGKLLEACIHDREGVIQRIQSSKGSLTGYEKMLQIIFEWTCKNLKGRASSNEDITFQEYGNYLAQNCQLVQVVVDNEELAFEIFEPMNSTSDPLTAFEVFKSNLIRHYPAFNLQDCDSLLKPLYDKRKRDDVQRLSNDLIFYSAQVFDGTRLAKRFLPLKQYLDGILSNRNNPKLTEFLRVLEAGARVLQAWNNEGGQGLLKFGNTNQQKSFYKSNPADLIRFLSDSNHDIAILPILRYEYENALHQVQNQNKGQDLAEIIKVVTAFFGLWRSVLTTNRLPNVYRNLFNKSNSSKPIEGSMRVDGGSLFQLDDYIEYFRDTLSNELVGRRGLQVQAISLFDLWYQTSNLNYRDNKTLCHLLLYVDQLYTLRLNATQTLTWIREQNIDHIMPSGQAGSDEIGNLAILDPKINKSIQDMFWDPDKRAIYTYLANPSRAHTPPKLPSGKAWPSSVDQNVSGHFHLKDILDISAQYNDQWSNDTIAIRSALIKARAWKVLYCDWLRGDQTDPASCQRASELLDDWTNVTKKAMNMDQFKEKWIRHPSVQELSAEAE